MYVSDFIFPIFVFIALHVSDKDILDKQKIPLITFYPKHVVIL